MTRPRMSATNHSATLSGGGRTTITLPSLEDANATHLSVMQIMQLLLESQIDQKTAGLLFYGLQIASSNLKHTNFEPETKDDPKKTAETRPRPATLEEMSIPRKLTTAKSTSTTIT